MADLAKDINDQVEQVSEAWATKFLDQRRSALQRRKIRATGALSDSLEHEVVKDATAAVVRILIAFNEEGRIAEMGRLHPHDKWGRNAVERLTKWVEARGVDKFVPGFLERRRLKKKPKDIINQIAWGIMVSRGKGKFRRRPWWNKAKTAAVDDLYNQAAIAVLDEAADGMIDLVKQAQRQGRR